MASAERKTSSGLGSTLRARCRSLLAWWKQTRLARTVQRGSETNANLLAGGITYTALFSLFAALAIMWTGFSWLLRSYPGVQETVLRAIDEALPGLIDLGEGGVLRPDQLILPNVVSWAGLIAVLVLIWSATSSMSALRSAVRTMLDIEQPPNVAAGKLRDGVTLIIFAFLILLSAMIAAGASALTTWLLNFTGLAGFGVVALPAVSILVALVMDMLIIVLVVKVIAGSKLPVRSMLSGALLAAVAFSALRLLGTAAVTQSAENNPLLAPFATIIALLILVNLAARICLLAAAWMWAGPSPRSPRVETQAR